VKTCTPKDLNAYREVLLEKGLGYKLPPPVPDLCVAVLGELNKRDQNIFLAGRFSHGKAELLLLPPDEKVLRRFADAFLAVERLEDSRTRSGATKVAHAIEASLEDGDEDESKHEHPGWDGGKWVGPEKKRLEQAGYYRFETTPPGGYPPPVRGDTGTRRDREPLKRFREKGVEIFCVSPQRLHGEGDIYSSSAVSLLSETKPGQTPSVRSFEHEGRLWVAMGSMGRGPFTYYVDAYELVPASEWKGSKKPKPFWFYYGRKVSVRGKPHILGKKAKFIPDNAKGC
jgi:hypothetical protein